MRKFLIFVLGCFLCFSICGCKAQTQVDNKTETKTPVVINLPKDSSVNGYRTSKPVDDNNIVDANKVTVGVPSGSVNNSGNYLSDSSGQYCGNANSKVFHSADCGSVSNMSENNKVYFKTREQAVADGYSPCKRCNP